MKRSKAESQDIIVNVFKDLLREKGYGKVSLQDISKAANISPSLVNYHFSSITNLYQEIWWRHFNNVHNALSHIIFNDKVTELFTYDILIQLALYKNKPNVDYVSSVYASKPSSLYGEIGNDQNRLFQNTMLKAIIMKKQVFVSDNMFIMIRSSASAVKKEMFLHYLDNTNDIDDIVEYVKEICYVANCPILFMVGYTFDEIKDKLDQAAQIALAIDTSNLLILG